jgi:hypothetical protein
MIIKEDKWSQFGHYLVGNDPTPIYHLKLALEKRKATGGTVKFIYHDQLFATANPAIEPSQSLLELYCERVRQLREKYDYLVLYYSGGADSHNILKCFEHTDTKLDEIVSFVDSSYKSKDSKISSEIYRVALPEVIQYQQRYPECKYSLIEIREVQNKLFTDSAFNFDLYQDTTYHLTPFGIMHYYGLYYEDRFHRMHDQGKRVGVIQGIDKVRLKHINGKWSFNFTDWSSYFGQKHHFRNFPTYDEFFYWTPDLPSLVIKQAHVAAKYMDYLDSISADHPYRNNELVNVVTRKSGAKTNWEYANHIIYPFWKQGTFSTGKTFESYISNARDNTLTSSQDQILRPYKNAVIKTLQLAKATDHHLIPVWINGSTDTNTIIGVRALFSVDHFIEN